MRSRGDSVVIPDDRPSSRASWECGSPVLPGLAAHAAIAEALARRSPAAGESFWFQ